jgi:uncharacterized protein YbjT (DUF2867 family)
MSNKLDSMARIILTGATGMVGEGVLHECLRHGGVEEVLVIGRTSCGVHHPKLKEIIHPDFYNLSAIEESIKGYNACFFCAGVTSVGKKEAEYYRLTHTMTLEFARAVLKQNPSMIFCYISGRGTDSTEHGTSMWARVKGQTENDLMKLPFQHVYNFRPGIIAPTKGLKNTLGLYKYAGWVVPVIRTILPKSVISLEQLGKAMLTALMRGYDKQIVEVKDIFVLNEN